MCLFSLILPGGFLLALLVAAYYTGKRVMIGEVRREMEAEQHARILLSKRVRHWPVRQSSN